MKIIVHGNPAIGFAYIGPFPDTFDVDDAEIHVQGVEYWWICDLDEPDRNIDAADLTEIEADNLDRFTDNEGMPERVSPFDNAGFKITRDMNGRAWAYSERTATTYDLTNGRVPDSFDE